MGKEICGESIDDLDSMFNRMKEMVHEVSTSMYEIQTKTCNGREAKIVDVTIKALKCENGNKNIVTVQEEIPITICGVEDPKMSICFRGVGEGDEKVSSCIWCKGPWVVKNRQVGLTILKRRNTNTPPKTALMCSFVNQN